jgi:hypothetical protein
MAHEGLNRASKQAEGSMAAKTLNRSIAMVWFDEVTQVGAFGAERLHELTGIPRRTLLNWGENVCAPPLDKLLHCVRAISSEDPPRGLRLWDRISALLGMVARPAPTPTPEASIPSLVLSVSSAEGAVSTWAEKALADGEVSTYEASDGRKTIRHLRHRLDTLGAAVDGLADSGPQRGFGGMR